MSYDYSENILVQESAGHLLEDELGWRVELAYNTEVLGETGTFGRKSYKEILLVKYLKEALLKLNPWLTPALLEDAIKTFESHMSSASLMQINEEKYRHIRDGIPVKVKKPNGQIEEKKAIVIDFTNTENNDFLAIKEMKIHGDLYRRRTDIVGFVNGIPLLFIELKKNSVDVQNAYTDNYTDYLDTIPHLFYYNAFLMLSNGTEAKVGTLGSKYEFFHEWKRLSEQEEGNVALETMLNYNNIVDALKEYGMWDELNSSEKTRKSYKNVPYLLESNDVVGRKLVTFMDTMLEEIEKKQFEIRFQSIADILTIIKKVWERDYAWLSIEIIMDEDIVYQISEDILQVIFDNLILNSVQQNENTQKLMITISINETNGFLNIKYCDNGKGLDDKYKTDPMKILEVHETTRTNGHGLGMWIVNNTCTMSGGEIQKIGGEKGFEIEFTIGGKI